MGKKRLLSLGILMLKNQQQLMKNQQQLMKNQIKQT